MTEIKLYNTKARAKQVFTPIEADNVRMYVCGPTVYDRAHLGNARPVVVFDVLYRLLRHVYGPEHVTYVRNFTDVDDKIIARAEQDGREIGAITSETTQWFLDDMRALGALDPDQMPRATQYIAPMITMIEDLIAKGHAYAAEGHVLFAVESYADYGQLSGRSVKDMIAGARVEVAPYKRNPMDFVLWKPSTDDQPGWDSPWGRGRPGWHIECSAMSYELLGARFDIHGGGNDLTFPHHENEIAQSCCAHPAAPGETCFAQHWLHNEMLQVEGRKMSKSLGNFFTVHDLLEKGVPGEVMRFVFLSTHYRKPMDWNEHAIEEATKTLNKWRNLLGDGPRSIASEMPENVLKVLADDLNTPQAIAELHKLANLGRTAELARAAELLGLLTFELGEWHREPELSDEVSSLIEKLIDARILAKDKRDYPLADTIRNELAFLGIDLKDIQGGSEWSYHIVRSANPLHRQLTRFLENGDHTGYSTLMQSLQRDGFGVRHFEAGKTPENQVYFPVGRSENERKRLERSLLSELKKLWELHK